MIKRFGYCEEREIYSTTMIESKRKRKRERAHES